MIKLFSTFLILAITCSFSNSQQESKKRSFIGINMGYTTPERYQPKDNCELIFYSNFNNNKISDLLKTDGNIKLNANNKELKVAMRSRKRKELAGTIILKESFEIRNNIINFSLDQEIPNKNSSLSTSIFFSPKNCSLDKSGHPKEYIRYFKRKQTEIIEFKSSDGRSHLIWGRNSAVKSGVFRNIVLKLSRSKITLLVDNVQIYSGKHTFKSSGSFNAGVWISSKGRSFGGGNMVFDNFVLEKLTTK